MFKIFYNFRSSPFTKNISRDNLFMTETLQETVSRLEYTISNKLFTVISGFCGTGKTTILRSYIENLDTDKYIPLYISDSRLTPRNLYNDILQIIGRDGLISRGNSRLKFHEDIEYIRCVTNRNLFVVIDEAHLLKQNTLEEIRFLLNFKMDSESQLALVLCGQPELLQRLDMERFSGIKQRVDLHCKLLPLTHSETADYIEHHLKIVEAETQIFTESAINEIFTFSNGLIRLINKVCIHSLLYGAGKEMNSIDDNVIKAVIRSEMK
jgi:type II secretory pathway predicted ATPase ExeA